MMADAAVKDVKDEAPPEELQILIGTAVNPHHMEYLIKILNL